MKAFGLTFLFVIATVPLWDVWADEPTESSAVASGGIQAATTVAEARARAMLLHESIRGTLQVVHRDFFDEDNTHAIPSASLEDVFDELANSYDVKLKWLIVETDLINVDHQPKDEFERRAVTALKDGEPRFESVEAARYRFAGPIRLASQCLKCHVRHRTDTEARTAGLSISMPLKRER
ncbi:c-type heme family protein [Aporhodopirellula aestuarii]|uniref:DUF3365 domain-containing protein n=1 Tax=Aporhodopirellula aestuarii TaxID=2950107 RepID=A0ABT0TYL5_9BACT|nr:DUF3365 domain-containing protein [Aporhodopirellula aestuarii]MCM2369688.1 DUF3365 domain-containing protein [Aporhodopirellula aestuarii]